MTKKHWQGLAKSRTGKVAICLIIANEIRGILTVAIILWQSNGLLPLVGG